VIFGAFSSPPRSKAGGEGLDWETLRKGVVVGSLGGQPPGRDREKGNIPTGGVACRRGGGGGAHDTPFTGFVWETAAVSSVQGARLADCSVGGPGSRGGVQDNGLRQRVVGQTRHGAENPRGGSISDREKKENKNRVLTSGPVSRPRSGPHGFPTAPGKFFYGFLNRRPLPGGLRTWERGSPWGGRKITSFAVEGGQKRKRVRKLWWAAENNLKSASRASRVFFP